MPISDTRGSVPGTVIRALIDDFLGGDGWRLVSRAEVERLLSAALTAVGGHVQEQVIDHQHTKQCWDDPGPGEGKPSLICAVPQEETRHEP